MCMMEKVRESDYLEPAGIHVGENESRKRGVKQIRVSLDYARNEAPDSDGRRRWYVELSRIILPE